MALKHAAVTVIGAYRSPYVRKVLACLHLKNVAYRIDPVQPYFGNAEFAKISPLRRVPVLLDKDLVLTDSTAICEYIDEAFEGAPLLPRSAVQRARARELEEYADAYIAQVLLWKVYNERVVMPGVWGRAPDETLVERALIEEVPRVMGHLEAWLPANGFLFGQQPMLADIAIATFFRNAAWAKFTVDGSRWPRSAAFVDRVLALPALASLRPFEDMSIGVPPPRVRAELAKIGTPLTETTMIGDMPQVGYFDHSRPKTT